MQEGLETAPPVLIVLAVALPIFLGTSIGYCAYVVNLKCSSLCCLPSLQGSGMLITVGMEELAPEAHENEQAETPW